eukprot:jgi/Antlo1/1787/1521
MKSGFALERSSPSLQMKRIRLKKKGDDLLRKLEYINLAKKTEKTKSDFIHDAKQIARTYMPHRRNPEFKYFIKYLIEDLVCGCDAGFICETINDLRRVFSKKVNENAKDEQRYEC